MRFLNLNTTCMEVFDMWPYTEEELDFINGTKK